MNIGLGGFITLICWEGRYMVKASSCGKPDDNMLILVAWRKISFSSRAFICQYYIVWTKKHHEATKACAFKMFVNIG